MCKYNPKIDLVFRKLFGSEENKDILLSFVNAILQKEHKLIDLTIKNPYNLASYIASKTSILDIKAVDESGVFYDIEMQINVGAVPCACPDMQTILFWQSGNHKGLPLQNGVIGIHLLDFPYFNDDRYKRRFIWKDAETNDESKFLAYQELYFIEMCKFNKEYKQLSDVLDRWMAFLNKAYELDKKNIPPELAEEMEIRKAIEKLEQFYFDNQEREIYDGERKFRLCMHEERRTAEEKGKIEGKIEIAKEMLLDGMKIEKIAKLTGLEIEQIKALITPLTR